MSEASKTPETDAIVDRKIAELQKFDGHMNAAVALNFLKPFMKEMADHARKLEQQRDAALERERGLREALQRAMPALWIMATSGNADAIAIHEKALAALAAKEEK